MPWTARDATRHSKKAHTPELRKTWSTVANKVFHQSGDDAKAIRVANSVVGRAHSRHAKKSEPPVDDQWED